MTEKQLYEALTSAADQGEARNAALRYLEETATDIDGFKRIIDPNTGRWQETFTANGHTYRIISPEQGVSLIRYSKLRASLAMVGRDFSLSEQQDQLARAKGHVEAISKGKDGIVPLSVLLEDMSQAVSRAQRKWHFALWTATLFIVREGEDLKDYDEGLAEQKVNDWNEAGLNAVDFFFCCLQWENKFNSALNAFSVNLV